VFDLAARREAGTEAVFPGSFLGVVEEGREVEALAVAARRGTEEEEDGEGEGFGEGDVNVPGSRSPPGFADLLRSGAINDEARRKEGESEVRSRGTSGERKGECAYTGSSSDVLILISGIASVLVAWSSHLLLLQHW
jgi:hypothetical protein